MARPQEALDLVVEHEHMSSLGSLTLAWASATIVEQPIPSSRLWAPFATAGPGPVLLYVLPRLPPNAHAHTRIHIHIHT